MLRRIIKVFKCIFSDKMLQNDLERFINEGQPKNAGDVDRLEREFYMQRGRYF